MYVLFHNYLSKKSIVVILIMMIAYLVYMLPLILDTYSSSSNEDLPLLYISISYLVLDLVFIFPASLVILNLGIFDNKNQGLLTFFP